MKFRNILGSIPLIIMLVIFDQASKTNFIELLKTKAQMTIKVTSWFSFVSSWNHGISFGLFSDSKYSNNAFLAINCLIVGYLVSLLASTNNKLQRLGITIIIGGAIGNLIDRFFRGAVFDFLYFHYNGYSFPAFNLADAFINIGVLFIILSFFRKP